MLLRTPLYDLHVRLGARMVEFAGWEMPLLYTGIIEEHHATRNHATFFDVSHMGRLTITGAQAEPFLERICTRRLAGMEVGQSRYSHICREDGGILDDVIVSRYQGHWGIVCNAANREKILAWLTRHGQEWDVGVTDRTFETAMVAIQGPEAIDLVASRVPLPVRDLRRYRFLSGSLFGHEFTIFRSGYTGEDGVEVIAPAGVAAQALEAIVDVRDPASSPVRPAGLGARDTLRTEASMPLYGHELTEEWDSLTAGQAWCVDLTKDFIGAEAMRALQQRGLSRILVGLRTEGRRAARQGCAVLADGDRIGFVTSGLISPTLGYGIAMAIVDTRYSEVGTAVTVDIRGTPTPASVVPMPFYKRPKK